MAPRAPPAAAPTLTHTHTNARAPPPPSCHWPPQARAGGAQSRAAGLARSQVAGGTGGVGDKAPGDRGLQGAGGCPRPPLRDLAPPPRAGCQHSCSVALPTVSRATAGLPSSPSSLPSGSHWTCWWRRRRRVSGCPPPSAPASPPCPRKGECSDRHFAQTAAGGPQSAVQLRAGRVRAEGRGRGPAKGDGLRAGGAVPAGPPRARVPGGGRASAVAALARF